MYLLWYLCECKNSQSKNRKRNLAEKKNYSPIYLLYITGDETGKEEQMQLIKMPFKQPPKHLR